MSAQLIDLLRSTNQWLGDCLDRLSSRHPSDLSPLAVDLQTLSGLIQQVSRTWRSASLHDFDQASETEIARYTENLRGLKTLLEQLQPQLEQQRAELHVGLTKLEAALRWAATVKQTREE